MHTAANLGDTKFSGEFLMLKIEFLRSGYGNTFQIEIFNFKCLILNRSVMILLCSLVA